MSWFWSQLRTRREREKMPPSSRPSPLVRPFVVLAVPGMYLVYKYREYKRQKAEQQRQKVTEKELDHLNQKIDKLLLKIDDNETEPPLVTSSVNDDECVICLQGRATMQTFPCRHKVVCRKCFVKTIQVAVAQRCLPLRCVICREKVLKLRQTSMTKTPLGFTSTSAMSRTTSVNLSPMPPNKGSICKRLPKIRPVQEFTPQMGMMDPKLSPSRPK